MAKYNKDFNIEDKALDSKSSIEKGNEGKKCSGKKFKNNRATRNDVSWYKSNKALFDSATSIPNAKVYGLAIPIAISPNMPVSPRDYTDYDYNAEHGVIINTTATLGEAYQASSPINRAALNVFNTIRGRYTPSVTFQSNDLACYFGAIGSIITLISHIKKCLGLVKYAKATSTIIPKTMLSGMGLNYMTEIDDYGTNLFKLQTQIDRLSALSIPAEMTYFQKCAWMHRHVYTESDGDHASTLFTMQPGHLLGWKSSVETTTSGIYASGLTDVVTHGYNKIITLIGLLATLISNLVDDDNVRNISVWINSYLPNAAVTSDVVNENLYPVPLKIKEFDAQIRNAIICPNANSLMTSGTVRYRQNVDEQIIVDNIIELPSSLPEPEWFEFFYKGKHLNGRVPFSNDEFMEFTRFTPMFTQIDAMCYRYTGDTFFINHITTVSTNYDNEFTAVRYTQHLTNAGLTSLDVYDVLNKLALAIDSPILPTPVIIKGVESEDADTGYVIQKVSYPLYEGFNKYIPSDSLELLHYTAVMSQFDASYLINEKNQKVK